MNYDMDFETDTKVNLDTLEIISYTYMVDYVNMRLKLSVNTVQRDFHEHHQINYFLYYLEDKIPLNMN